MYPPKPQGGGGMFGGMGRQSPSRPSGPPPMQQGGSMGQQKQGGGGIFGGLGRALGGVFGGGGNKFNPMMNQSKFNPMNMPGLSQARNTMFGDPRQQQQPQGGIGPSMGMGGMKPPGMMKPPQMGQQGGEMGGMNTGMKLPSFNPPPRAPDNGLDRKYMPPVGIAPMGPEANERWMQSWRDNQANNRSMIGDNYGSANPGPGGLTGEKLWDYQQQQGGGGRQQLHDMGPNNIGGGIGPSMPAMQNMLQQPEQSQQPAAAGPMPDFMNKFGGQPLNRGYGRM